VTCQNMTVSGGVMTLATKMPLIRYTILALYKFIRMYVCMYEE